MSTINLGRVRPSFKGNYDASVAYKALERIIYLDDCIYEAVVDVPIGTAPSVGISDSYWAFIGATSEKVQAVDEKVQAVDEKVQAVDEKVQAVDENTVHKTGDETITGEKTFTSKVNFRSNDSTVPSGIKVENDSLFIESNGTSLQSGPVIIIRQPTSTGRKKIPMTIKTGDQNNDIGHQMSISFNTGEAVDGGNDYGHIEFASLKNNSGFYLPMEFTDYTPNTWGWISSITSQTWEAFDRGMYLQRKYADGLVELFGRCFVTAGESGYYVPLRIPPANNDITNMFVVCSGFDVTANSLVTFHRLADRIEFYRKNKYDTIDYALEIDFHVIYHWR